MWYWSLPFRLVLSAAILEPPVMDSLGVRGTNLGGLFVLEPWITPSLFYQFEGRTPEETAVDSYTFCEVLGPKEANRQLRMLWETWVTEKDIADLKSFGLNTIRLPVGDYMFQPYGPYVSCFDGSLDVLDRVLGWCASHSLKVLLDMHVVRGNANGFDNGGLSSDLFWDREGGTYSKAIAPRWLFSDYVTWLNDKGESKYARVVGPGRFEKAESEPRYSMQDMNWANFNFTIGVLTDVACRYNSSVWGLEVVNEPSWLTPIDILQFFYDVAEREIHNVAPELVIFFHDKFRFFDQAWETHPLPGATSVLDTHIYLAWDAPLVNRKLFKKVCKWKDDIAARRENGTRVVVGEWSIATDTCALFLTGYNFALPEVVYTCQRNPHGCPSNFSEAGVVPRVPNVTSVGGGLGPTLAGDCPIGAKAHHVEVEKLLGRALFEAYSSGDGFFFWNFKTENEDPRWDYGAAVRTGLLPPNASAPIVEVCDHIDTLCDANPSLDCDNYIASFTSTYRPPASNSPGVDVGKEVVGLLLGLGIVIVVVSCFYIFRLRKSRANAREVLMQGYRINDGPTNVF